MELRPIASRGLCLCNIGLIWNQARNPHLAGVFDLSRGAVDFCGCGRQITLYPFSERFASHGRREVTRWGLTKTMSGRPAIIRQREAKQIISAATKVGAKKVEFLVGAVPVIVHLGVAADVELPSDSNNSFDKIMRGK